MRIGVSMTNFFDTMTKQQARNVNSLVLAYVGDAVHSLFVREKLAATHLKAGELHKIASNQVNAHAQSQIAERLLPHLTEEEKDVLMRGRNSKNTHVAKNQTQRDYKLATGLEAVLGYLYLIGDLDRIKYLLQLVENNDEN